MTAHLAAAIAGYAAFLAIWAIGAGLSGRDRGTSHSLGLMLLWVACVVQAVLDGAGLLHGHRPAEPATHLGYLAASILVLPIVMGSAAGDDGPWAASIVATGCIATAIVALRLTATWHTLPA